MAMLRWSPEKLDWPLLALTKGENAEGRGSVRRDSSSVSPCHRAALQPWKLGALLCSARVSAVPAVPASLIAP